MTPASEAAARGPLRPSFFAHHRLGFGVALYAAAALADTAMTLQGVGADLELEGNPAMRAMMEWLGAGTGLATQKAAIGGSSILIAIVGERAIRNREPWLRWIPASRWVRAWMGRRDRSWIAFIPLYAAAIGQGLAVASWAALSILG